MSGIKVVVVLCAVIAVLSRLAARDRPGDPEAAPQQPFGRYTAQQMLDRTTPIFRMLLPQQPVLLLSAESCAAPDGAGNMWRRWYIDDADEQGKILARIICDADTGDICNVYRNGLIADSPNTEVNQAHLRIDGQALVQAEQWLHALGYAERWQIERATQHGGSIQDIRLSDANRTALLGIDARTGALLFAEIQP